MLNNKTQENNAIKNGFSYPTSLDECNELKDVLNDGNYIEDCVSVKLLNDLNEIPVTKRPIHCTDQKRKNFVEYCKK